MNRDFEFSLTFAIPETIALDEIEERLFKAGCDDAIIGFGQKGRLGLNFTREAVSAETAILSALRDVKQAFPQARLVEAAPDLVGISDMAKLLGFSRQNMRKLIIAHQASFPLPLHEGASAIWHLADVLLWLSDKRNRSISPSLLAVARVSMGVNLARETERVDRRLQAQLKDIA
ncbi:MAG TPA: DNA-binding protein [Marinobacter sp.]|uniref:DNA-binding protein n=2 Tax=root TaxID=1 RepID=A0A831VXD8_9GAMM|nr:DNA-binding protein [Marinobacter antarcticus]HDZ39239.1 DNA-binding protein [Marinobacter sp.]HEA51751.1 DNA-binding protein [Marinobacter antarcticus]